jgi:hypothetical protein
VKILNFESDVVRELRLGVLEWSEVLEAVGGRGIETVLLTLSEFFLRM